MTPLEILKKLADDFEPSFDDVNSRWYCRYHSECTYTWAQLNEPQWDHHPDCPIGASSAT